MQSLIDRRKVRGFRKIRFWKRHVAHLDRPRLCVFRSTKHVQAQLIDDATGKVITSASSMEKSFRTLNLSGLKAAEKIGQIVAERGVKQGIKAIVFDRNGFNYHGRIKAVADAARAAGLEF